MKKKIIILLLVISLLTFGLFSLTDNIKGSFSKDNQKLLSYQEYESVASTVNTLENGFSQTIIEGYNLIYQVTLGYEVEVVTLETSKFSPINNLTIPSYIKNSEGLVYKVIGIGANAFNSEELVDIIEQTIYLPDSIKYIKDCAFKDLNAVTAIEYSGTELSEIGKSAFEGTQIRNFNLTENIKVIKENVFYGTKLESIKIPNGVEHIETNAFAKSSLKVVNFGTGLKRIDSNALDCVNLRYVYFQGSAPTCGENIFGANNKVVLYREYTAAGWNYDYDYLSSLGTYHVKTLDDGNSYYEIRVSEFNILDFVNIGIDTLVFNSKDYQGVEYELDKRSGDANHYTARVVGFKDVVKKNIFIPDEVIYDGDTYKITVISSDLTANEIVEKVVLDTNIKTIEANAFINCPNLKTVCFVSNEAVINGKIFNTGILDYEIVGNNVTINNVTDDERNTILTHVYTGFNVEQEVHLDAQGVFYSIVADEEQDYAVVGSPHNGDDEQANTSKYAGSDAISGEIGYVVIPDYICIGNNFYKVRSVGRYAFYNNQSVKYIKLGAFIGEESNDDKEDSYFAGVWDCSLRNCSELTGFKVDERNSYLIATSLNDTDNSNGTAKYLCEKDKNLQVASKIVKASVEITRFSIVGLQTIKTIESYAFASCYKLFELVLYNSEAGYGVEKIGKHTFENTPIGMNGVTTTLDFTTINEVGEYSFQNCTYIKQIINIKDLEGFGRFVFRYCSGLEAFDCLDTNERYVDYENVLYEIREDEQGVEYLVLVQFPAQKKVDLKEEYKINVVDGYEVRIIEAYAFTYSQINNVTLGESVYIVGKEAFANSTKLTKVNVGKNVVYLGMEILLPDDAEILDGKKDVTYLQALTKAMNKQRIDSVDVYEQEVFDNCYSLNNFNIDKENLYYLHDTNGILYNKDKTTLLIYPMGNTRLTFTIPATITKIALEAFENNTHIQRIIVPEGVTEVGAKAFNGCTNLSSIYFRTLSAPNIYEQVFNSAGANVNGLTIYCIQQPDKWYEGKEFLWQNYNVEKYNAIQDITNQVTTADPLYMLFVTDADGNSIADLNITVITTSGKERKTITDENGYAYFSIPSQDALTDSCTVKMVIEDMNDIFYDYINNDFLLDLNTSFSNISLTAVPTVNGQRYEEYYWNELFNVDVVTRSEDISSSVIFVNKVALARTEAFGLPIRNADGELQYLCDMKFTVKVSYDSKTTPKNLYVYQDGKVVLKHDFSLDKNDYSKFDEQSGIVTFDKFPIDVFGNDDSKKISLLFEFDAEVENDHETNELNVRIFEYEYEADYIAALLNIDKIEYNFDPDIPLIGGTKVEIEADIPVLKEFSISSYYEKDRYIFGLNLEHEFDLLPKNKNYKPEDPYTGIKRDESWKSYAELGGALKALKNYNKMTKEQKKAFGETVITDSIKLEFSGAVEMMRDGLNGSNRVTEGTIVGKVTYKFVISKTFLVWVIPVNITAEFSASGQLQLTWSNISLEQEKEENLFQRQPAVLSLEVGVKLSGGVGCRLASVGIYGYAGLEFVFEISKQFHLEEINGKFDFGVYLKVKLGFISFKAEKSLIPDSWKSVKIYPKNDEKGIRYCVRTTDGNEIEYQTLAAVANDVINDVDNTLKPSEDDYSFYGSKEPQVVTYNGKTYKFYIDNVFSNPGYINKTSNSYNYLKLVYSELQPDGSWSDPIIINNNDNFNEIEFKVAVDNNGINLLYTKATESMTVDTAEYFTSKLNVVHTLFNGESFNHQIISESKYYKYNLELGVIDNELYASWLENKDNSIYGVSNKMNEDNTMENTTANSIHIYKNSINGWNEVTTHQDLGLMIDQHISKVDGKKLYTFIYDKDGNLPTVEDRYIYMIDLENPSEIIKNNIKLDDEFYGDGIAIHYIGESGNDILIQNDMYIYKMNYDYNTKTITLEEIVYGISSSFEFIYQDGKIVGVIYLLSEETVLNEGTEDEQSVSRTDLVISLYDEEEGFLNPVKITNNEFGEYVDYFEIYEYLGQTYILVNHLDIKVIEDNQVFNYSDKLVEFKTESDIVLNQIQFNDSTINDNDEFSVTLQITNNSIETVNNVYVDLVKDGNVVATFATPAKILSGMTENVKVEMMLVTVEKEYDVLVRTDIKEDDLTNNVIKTQFAFPDILVNVKTVSMGGIKYLLVFMQNVGALPSDPGTIYIANGSVKPFDMNEGVTGIEHQEIDYLYEANYDSLQPLEYKYYTIELNKVYFTDSLVTVYAVSSDDSEEVLDNNICYMTIDENQVVSGIGTYKVTYHIDGALDGVNKYVEEYEVGDTIKPLAYSVPEGYEFKGWYNLPTIMPNRDIDVYGICELQYYTVIYEVDGIEVYRDLYEFDASINLRNISQEGYSFTEWLQYDYINDQYLDAPTKMPSHNIILSASKQKLSYNINYYVNGVKQDKVETVKYDTNISGLSLLDPSMAGYTFSGWNDLPERMPAHDLNLYCTLTKNNYNVFYHVDRTQIDSLLGSSYPLNIKDKETIQFEGKINSVVPTVVGFEFIGWYKDANYQTLVSDYTMPSSNLDLYGKYQPIDYTIEYMVGNTVVHTATYNYNQTIEEFNYQIDGSSIDWLNIPTKMPARDFVVYSSTTKNLYDVEYYLDGNLLYTDKCLYANDINLRPEEVKEGYSFDGWYKDANYTLKYQLGTMPNETLKLYGRFNQNTYKLRYIVNGEVVKTENYKFGDAVTLYTYEPGTGLKVSEWSKKLTTMPANDVDLYAVTITNLYKLKYYVDNELVLETSYGYNDKIVPYNFVPQEGYVVSSWEGLTELMPNGDLSVYATTSKGVYSITYYINGKVDKVVEYTFGDSIEKYQYLPKEGTLFLGFVDEPSVMPANDLNVYGYTSEMIFSVKYFVGDELIYTDSYCYGDIIIERGYLIKEGYKFSGWSDIPETMPANDLEIKSNFEAIDYKVYYYVNKELVDVQTYNFQDEINPLADVITDGYTFSGWSDIPKTMPSNDLYVNAALTVNTYKVNYYINDSLYKVETYNYNEEVTLEQLTDKGFSGWTYNDEVITTLNVPSKDVNLYATISEELSTGVVVAASSASTLTLGGGIYLIASLLRRRKKSIISTRF